MKIAISNIAWSKHNNKEVANLLEEMNIKGLELAPTKIWADPLQVSDEMVRDVLGFWYGRGINCIAMQSLLYGRQDLGVFSGSENRKKTSDYLVGMIDLASRLKIQRLVFGSPKNRNTHGLEGKKAFALAVDFFRELGEFALERNTLFCIEPNAPQYGCDFVTNTQEGIELVRAVDSRGFGLHLDAGVMLLNGEDYQASLDQALPYLKHFHISEPYLDPVGGKEKEHSRLAQALRNIDYQGWVSVEMKEVSPLETMQTIKSTLTYVRNIFS